MARRGSKRPDSSGFLLPSLSLSDFPVIRTGPLSYSEGGRTAWVETEFIIGDHGIDNQLEVLNFLVAQALEQTVHRVVIDREHDLYQGAIQVDERERRLRHLVPNTARYYEVPLVRALFGPLQEEFNVTLGRDSITYTYDDEFGSDPMKQLSSDLMLLHQSVYRLALGMTHKVQIDIPLDDTKKAARRVRQSTRNPRTASDLATLYGILESYETTRIEGVQFKAKASPTLANRLKEIIQERLMDDDTYWALSICGCSLGIPRRLRPTLVDFGRLSRNLLQHPSFKHLYRAGTRLLQVALRYETGVKIPLPASQEFAELFDQQYFPAIGSPPLAVPRFEDWVDIRFEQEALRLGLPPSSFPKMARRTDNFSDKHGEMRRCSVCGETKSRDEFHDDRLASGYGRICRTCKTHRNSSARR
jgi:hypothetical protein